MTKSIFEHYSELMNRAKEELDAVDWKNRRVYAGWLAQTYYFVRHSSRLLALGAASAKLHEDSLHRRMVSHLREEMGHDKIAALDIKNLGFTLADFPELTTTKAFYQNQYYTLQNEPAASFLGWILFLEGVAATLGPKVYNAASEAFDSKCTQFIKLHAEEDQDHIKSALDVAAKLSNDDGAFVIANMNQSADLYLRMLSEIQASASMTNYETDHRTASLAQRMSEANA